MSHIKYFKVGEGHSAPLLPPPPIHPQPLGTQGGLTTKPRGPGRGTGPGWGLDPWPLPPLAQSPHCPPLPSWALTCDGEDREEDGYQRLDAEAHLGGQLLTEGELAALIALAHCHGQGAGAREARPPVV